MMIKGERRLIESCDRRDVFLGRGKERGRTGAVASMEADAWSSAVALSTWRRDICMFDWHVERAEDGGIRNE